MAEISIADTEILLGGLSVNRMRLDYKDAVIQTHVFTGILSTRTKHIVRVLVNGVRVHETVFPVDKKLGQTTSSERARAEVYCVEITRKLSSDPACKSFTISEDVGKKTLELTEEQFRRLEAAD